ncbi:MAG: hypothetical protein ACKV22_38620 [Bryobacteraceae bacterium]
MRLLFTVVATVVALRATPKPLAPAIEQVFPQSLHLGETADVLIEGNYLDGASSVRFDSDRLSGRVLESSFTRARIRVVTRPEADAGLYSGRIETRRGVTNLFHLRLTGWRTMSESEPNDRAEQATAVQLPVSLNGVIESYNDSDFYRFHARTGERLAFNLLMGRNGYATGHEIGHFTLTLTDTAGKVLHTQLSRFLMDPYFQFTFSREGDYFLIANHSRMAVSCLESDCQQRRTFASYQLAIGASPVLWSLWPPAGRAGSTVTATLEADFLPTAPALDVSGTGVSARIAPAKPGQYRVDFKIADDAAEGMRLISVDDPAGLEFPLTFHVFRKEFQLESEPNDSRDQSPLIRAPFTLVGRIDRSRDVDSFSFMPTGAEALSFRLTSRTLGSEIVDPALHVLCKEGDIAVTNDDDASLRNPRSRDPYLEFKASDARACLNPEDGYYVQIRDSSTKFGPGAFYVFEAEKPRPSFEAGLRMERIQLERGRSTSVPVSVRRLGGFNGDVEVKIEGAPAGVEAKPLTIPGGQTAGSVELSATGVAAHVTARIRIIASAKIGDTVVTKDVVTPQPMLGDGAGFVQTATQPVLVTVVDPVVLALERIPPPGAGFAADRHKLMLNGDRLCRVIVKVERAEGFTGPVEYSFEGLPPGTKFDGVEWKDGGTTAHLSVKALPGADLRPGEYRVTVVASSGPRVREALRAFFVRVEK